MNPSSRNRASQNAGPGAGEAHQPNPAGTGSGFRLLLDLGVDYAQCFYVGEPTDNLAEPVAPRSLKAARGRKKEAG